MINVAIILVNWNGKKDTLECLTSLDKLKTPALPAGRQSLKLKVIVVDNGSTDDSVEVIRRKFPDVEVIETGKNLGFSGGNNIGIRRALEDGADFIWLLNNDTTVDKNALTALVDAVTDRRVGIAGSKIYFAPGREFHKDRYEKIDRGRVLWYAGGIIDWKNMYASHRGVDEVDHGQYDAQEETPFVTGCSMMIRKEVIDTVGMLDEKLFMYFEDVDFCLRVHRHGWKCLYVPKAIVWHVNAGSSGSPGSDTHQYYQTRNRFVMGMRYAAVRTKFALMKEALRIGMIGPSIQQKAVIDAVMGKRGKA